MNPNKFKSDVRDLIKACKNLEGLNFKISTLCELLYRLENHSSNNEELKSYIKTIKWLFIFRDYIISDIESYEIDFSTDSKWWLFVLKYQGNYSEVYYKKMINIRIKFLEQILKLENKIIIETFKSHKTV